MADLQKTIEKLVNDTIDDLKRDYYKAINYAYKEMSVEAQKMYDKLIDDFYLYETQSYIRHGQTRYGTKTGENLYRANGIYFRQGRYPYVDIEFTPEDMQGYQHDSSQTAFWYISRGIRYPYGDEWKYNMWSGSYSGKYFKVKNVTLQQAFNKFEKEFDDISADIFDDYFSKLGW